MELDDVTGIIVDSSVGIHRELGPGLLESVYEAILANVLEGRGLQVDRQVPIAFEFRGVRFAEAFRVDLLVDRRVIVEIKSVEKLAPVHAKQVITYLKLTGLHVGLLINFGAPMLRDGLQRLINGTDPSASLCLGAHRS